MASLKSIPSVKYLILVCAALQQSSNLTEYPTSFPKTTPLSWATLFATDVAAIRLGKLTAMQL